jgi:molybdopterin/thiamine biosynthesis adenylyltransferase
VEDHNLSTQFFGKWNLGQTKVQALATELYRRHGCRVEKHPVNLTEKNAKALLKNSALIICTFDNKISRELVQRNVPRRVMLTYGDNRTGMASGISRSLPKSASKSWTDVGCIMAGMHGREYYAHVDWAENFIVPEDPVDVSFDPCNYPLTVTLAVWTSSAITEIAINYLIEGIKHKMTGPMLARFHATK